MSFLRPAARDMLARWSEVAAAAGLAALGLWALRAGGYLFTPLGLLLLLLGLLWALVAYRRLAFDRPVAAPGVVEVVEGQVSYFGPHFGGAIALDELSELRLIATGPHLHWRLKTQAGEVLMIPTAAAGAELLHDAFAALPGVNMAALTRALSGGATTGPVWARQALVGHGPMNGRAGGNHEKS